MDIGSACQADLSSLLPPVSTVYEPCSVGLGGERTAFYSSRYRCPAPDDRRIELMVLILGVCILLRVWDQGEGFSVYATLLSLRFYIYFYFYLTVTCFGRTTIFKQKYIVAVKQK
jgi:hypothetical protein